MRTVEARRTKIVRAAQKALDTSMGSRRYVGRASYHRRIADAPKPTLMARKIMREIKDAKTIETNAPEPTAIADGPKRRVDLSSIQEAVVEIVRLYGWLGQNHSIALMAASKDEATDKGTPAARARKLKRIVQTEPAITNLDTLPTTMNPAWWTDRFWLEAREATLRDYWGTVPSTYHRRDLTGSYYGDTFPGVTRKVIRGSTGLVLEDPSDLLEIPALLKR